ncbi:orotidine-5'-phosphate decarboxylase [Helicobacter suis]|uniref:orotidine-5'-phosphate decarboxylase n=1 Tax=Helicobacter suis TaxID=104628 RepID=UPI001967FC44|nr:orotidine-5'-phosphate decarboxylase [Helicobacter suis]
MQLCLALDLDNKRACLDLLKQLQGLNLWVKLGLRGFIREGPQFIQEIKNLGFKIFLDLKLHDITSTMQKAALECAKLGVDMITLHASAGSEALVGVVEKIRALKKAPLLMGVSILTSLEESQVEQIYHMPLQDQVLHLAQICFKSGLDGVVCSVFESKAIKQATSTHFLTLTPAIRPFTYSLDDQKRVGNLEDAKRALADFIVIGRPIYNDSNPLQITTKILEKIGD